MHIKRRRNQPGRQTGGAQLSSLRPALRLRRRQTSRRANRRQLPAELVNLNMQSIQVAGDRALDGIQVGGYGAPDGLIERFALTSIHAPEGYRRCLGKRQ